MFIVNFPDKAFIMLSWIFWNFESFYSSKYCQIAAFIQVEQVCLAVSDFDKTPPLTLMVCKNTQQMVRVLKLFYFNKIKAAIQ